MKEQFYVLKEGYFKFLYRRQRDCYFYNILCNLIYYLFILLSYFYLCIYLLNYLFFLILDERNLIFSKKYI